MLMILSFSTNKKIFFFITPLIRDALNKLAKDIKINNKKTVFSSKKFNTYYWGNLSNDDKISLGKSEKRIISAMVHHFKMRCLKLMKYIS
jgi:hypothetical protein